MDAVVIGGSGLAGLNVIERFDQSGINTVGTYNSSRTTGASVYLDKTDREAVFSLIDEREPDLIVDAAAFHDVDACEKARQKAWSVNVSGTHHAAVAADKVGAHFVYLSTDYVFPDRPDQAPFTEADPVHPPNYYARCKYAGEQAAQIPERSTILRSSVLYGDSSPNFLTWVVDQLRAGEVIEIVDDQVGTPTFAPDVAEACLRIHQRGVTGLFHAAGPESVSRYEFTIQIADAYDLDVEGVIPISTEELGQAASRPADSSLDSTELYDTIDYVFHDPASALKRLA
jgi:dTDP-4-dehydrorhamnose reductase